MPRKMSINDLREALAIAEEKELRTIGHEMQRITGLTSWQEIFISIVSKPDEIVKLFHKESKKIQERNNRRKRKRDEKEKQKTFNANTGKQIDDK